MPEDIQPSEGTVKKNKGGRPRKEIQQDAFEKLCALFCTQEEICDFFDVTTKTLNSWCKRTYHEGFSQVYDKKKNAGKISLRRKQMKLADKSAAMAIFLGKNILGQSDNPNDGDNGERDKQKAASSFIQALEANAAEVMNDGGDQPDDIFDAAENTPDV